MAPWHWSISKLLKKKKKRRNGSFIITSFTKRLINVPRSLGSGINKFELIKVRSKIECWSGTNYTFWGIKHLVNRGLEIVYYTFHVRQPNIYFFFLHCRPWVRKKLSFETSLKLHIFFKYFELESINRHISGTFHTLNLKKQNNKYTENQCLN